jgi:hypothetical protein
MKNAAAACESSLAWYRLRSRFVLQYKKAGSGGPCQKTSKLLKVFATF